MRTVGLLLVLWAAPVTAAVDGGEALYHAGVEAFRAGDYATATVRFEAALKALPESHGLVAQSRYNIARALQELGRPCDAQAAFERYIVVAEDKPDEARRLAKARAALPDVGPRCVASRPAPAPAPAPPARVAVRPEPEPVTRAAEAPALPTEAGVAEVTDPDVSGRAIGGWLALGAGVVSVVVGGVMNAAAQDDLAGADSAYDDFIESGRADLDARDDVRTASDSAESGANTSYLLFGVGGALVGMGGWLLLTDDGASVAASVAPGSAAVIVGGAW